MKFENIIFTNCQNFEIKFIDFSLANQKKYSDDKF